MILLDDIKLEFESYSPKIKELFEVLEIKILNEKISKLEEITAKSDFWNDSDTANVIIKELQGYKNKVGSFVELQGLFDDISTLIEMAFEEDDDSLIAEIKSEFDSFKKKINEITLTTLLTGEYDYTNAILTFHSGAGGTEAQDWAEMLFRMYTRWGERRGFKVTTLDYLDGDEAGLKSASILIEGINAYGYLKSESGVHRLVRISPFDSSGRRHTSFASLEVMPEITDDAQIDIKTEDIKVDTYRASGAGGQHINKTDSAVRITHIPTGIVVACQTQRSQHQNRDYALKMLKAKLAEIKEREHLEKIEDIKGVQKEIAWGAQIRSYVFMPYTLVKDHRSNFENGNVNAVMDGDLDGFINAYLKGLSLGTLK